MPVKAAFQGWLLIVLLVLVSVYDIRKRMIPDQLQIAIACLAALNDSWITLLGIFGALPYLCVVYVSDDGIGGGDIKLTAVLGYVYGPYRLAGILLTASLLASLAAFLFRKQKSIPFVPFLAAGSFFMMFV